MLKIRLTYSDTDELNDALDVLRRNFEILNQSKEYKGRGASKYSNIYLDVENKRD